jgi:Flp pilus assembly protein TadD
MRWQIRSKRYLVVAVLLGSISAHSQTGRTVGNAHVGKGYALVQNNQFAEAASEFRAALAVDPETLGIAYGENGKYEAAIAPLKRAAQLDPDSFEIVHNLGLSYFRLQRFWEARAPLERAVQLRPNFFGSNALLGPLLYSLALLYCLKDDEAAYHVLDFAHRLNPEDGDTSEPLFRVSVILGNPDLQRHIREIENLIGKQQ